MDAIMECLQAGDTSLPMLPSIAMRVIELAADPDVHIAQLTGIVMKDQILASRVLALANSARNAPSQAVTSLPQAMVRLGVSSVRNLVLAVSFSSKLCDERTYGPLGRRLMDHGLGTAYLGRLVAEAARVDVDEAFLCGLVHDIGKLIIYKAASDCHCNLNDSPDLAAFIADRHAEIGARALRAWHLPPSLEQPVLHHHHYEQALGARRKAAVLYFADRLSHHYGFGCDRSEGGPEQLLEDPVCAELAITAAWLSETDEHAPGLFTIARQVLQ
jgi:putative nucleotidyltransferase with HDIG domain